MTTQVSPGIFLMNVEQILAAAIARNVSNVLSVNPVCPWEIVAATQLYYFLLGAGYDCKTVAVKGVPLFDLARKDSTGSVHWSKDISRQKITTLDVHEHFQNLVEM